LSQNRRVHAITDINWVGDCMNIYPIVFMGGFGQQSVLSALVLQKWTVR